MAVYCGRFDSVTMSTRWTICGLDEVGKRSGNNWSTNDLAGRSTQATLSAEIRWWYGHANRPWRNSETYKKEFAVIEGHCIDESVGNFCFRWNLQPSVCTGARVTQAFNVSSSQYLTQHLTVARLSQCNTVDDAFLWSTLIEIDTRPASLRRCTARQTSMVR